MEPERGAILAGLRLLRPLGHPLRLRIVLLLEWRGEATAAELRGELGVTARALAHQLHTLRRAGWVEGRSASLRLQVRTVRPLLEYLAAWEARQRPASGPSEEEP